MKKATKLATMALAAAMMFTVPLQAKIDLVTLPARDQSELTIYNSQDLTLVRETRRLSFSRGMNEIQFSWANTLIDPTSLQIDLGGNAALEILDAVYPANTQQLIVWNIQADEETSGEVEITYFTSGLTWSANYVIIANNEQSEFNMQQFTKVSNNSGEDFENAVTRVVVGEVNLLEAIAELARRGITVDQQALMGRLARIPERGMRMDEAKMMDGFALSAAPMAQEAKAIIKKAVSEYYIFAVEGKEDILDGWGKELPNPKVENIPFDLSYEIDSRKYGQDVVKIYKLKNTEDHELGEEPLPGGRYYVYSEDGRDGLRFEGSTSSKYIPVGEDIELNLGSDGMVLFEEREISTKRSDVRFGNGGNVVGWRETKVVELEVKNSRDRDVPVKLTHYFQDGHELQSASIADYERVDQNTVRWEFDVPAKSKEVIELKVVYGYGTLANSNR